MAECTVHRTYQVHRTGRGGWCVTRTCGALGCTDPADVVIDHPDHGERVVCDDDADGYEVVDDV